MGGIFGFVCRNEEPISKLKEGLRRLVYRGYDGVGYSFFNGELKVRKSPLQVDKADIFSGNAKVAIAHTRYASRGWPTMENTHPILDCKGKIAVVMDGIIEDYEKLRDELKARGHNFVTTTDTEVIPHLLEEIDPKDILRIKGMYSLAYLTEEEKDKIFFIQSGQPLYIGIGKGECTFISSDIPSLYGFSEEALEVPDSSYGFVTYNVFKVFDNQGREIKDIKSRKVKYTPEIAEKAGYPHFMLKEIYEIPEAIIRSFESLMDKYLRLSAMIIYSAKHVYVVGNGTSYHAGLVSSYYLSENGIGVNVVSSAEFPYFALDNVGVGDVVVAISQSGETGDVVRSIKAAKMRGSVILGITNSVGSRLALESNVYLPITAGPEMAVPATKTFTSTLIVLLALSNYVGMMSGKKDEGDFNRLKISIKDLSESLEKRMDEISSKAKEISEKVYKHEGLYVSSSGINFPISLEGALKFKEAAYLHAEGIQLGELLHGPIVLTNMGYPTVIVRPAEDASIPLYEKVLDRIASKNNVVTLGPEESFGSVKTSKELSPIANIVPLQLLAYYTGVKRGTPIDTPAGLVKAVIT
ncbi:glutamine--fructose-6-phosphate transaminase (isomerizing) [Acidianus sp. RZ1]|uniref:glutamine--fructose-6-phosphate transaminase (isomerizing) n=1 Tax=Acidianus sp. RZ1 TaxID=1540082 RepID=UPI0014909395|nr:glutamine--fructose-6-phosphate transaminase (isomerizing) [Acidianus sp. RZ1]NON61215.1 glutamine--fructose-6-phosphate transaminase (isomerizing) [Acidianus sp. RZ1]